MTNSTPLDPRALRMAFGAFATGVTVVTTRASGEMDAGLTANSFSSVSLDPPMVLWSLAKTSSSIEAFRAASHFAVHVLSAAQEAISNRFAGKSGDRFAGLSLTRGPGDVPLLDGCSARFACRTVHQYEGGDHVIFVGEVLDMEHAGQPPLAFHGGRYAMVFGKEWPEAAADDASGASLTPDDLIYNISRAYHHIRRDAVRKRIRIGLTNDEYAALSVLGREGEVPSGGISGRTRAADQSVTLGTLSRLATRGLVEHADSQSVSLTQAGRHVLVEMIAILKNSEADALDGFDQSEVQLLKRFLRRLVDDSPAHDSADSA